MKVNDEKLHETTFYQSQAWIAKKAMLENERCTIADEMQIWSIGNEDRIRVQLISASGEKSGIFGMTPEQFEERAPGQFIQDMWALSDTKEMKISAEYATHNHFSKETQDKILERLEELEAKQQCHRCRNEEFALLDGFLNHQLTAAPNHGGGLGAPLISTVGLVCTNCGNLVMHTVGILDIGLE